MRERGPLCAACEQEGKGRRESRAGEKRGGKRDGQPQLSASLNVLTVQLNISMCHELFVSPNVCLFVCVQGAEGLRGCGRTRSLSVREPSLFLSTRSLPAAHPSAW